MLLSVLVRRMPVPVVGGDNNSKCEESKKQEAEWVVYRCILLRECVRLRRAAASCSRC